MATKVAVVTGANRGIGFAIVRGLCKRFDGVVYLTSRNVVRGEKAVSDLWYREGLSPCYHQLDIADRKSLKIFRNYISNRYSGIDILVNNAAIAFRHDAPEPLAIQAQQTIAVNYFALLATCEVLLPIIKYGGRIINLSSSAGRLCNIPGKNIREKLKDETLTIQGLSRLMNQYVEAARRGCVKEWGNSPYVVSKAGVTALTVILQKMLNCRDIKVNAVHPGYVSTSMSSHKGPRTIDQGAQAPLYLALDAPDYIRGQFIWFDKQIADWEGDKHC